MQEDPAIGRVIGSYRVLSFLGEGGMARVYRAEHATIGKEAALKLLRPEYSSRPQSVARFFHEAQAVNRIRHENLVDIFDFGQTPEGEHYILMELLHGEPLTDTLQAKRPLPVERILRIGVQVCAALEAAHQKGIVHRDLKDANVFLTTRAGQRDFVKILDFGIAKLMEGETPEVLKTKTGAMLGTPLYISPEQARGAGVGPATDIYALGCLLFCMATGEPPFYDENAVAVALKHIDEAPPSPRDKNSALPAAFSVVILRCLEKAPEARYPSMAAVSAALEDSLWLASKSTPPAETERLQRKSAPPRVGVWLGGAAALLIASLVGYQLAFGKKAQAETPVELNSAANPPSKKETPLPQSQATTLAASSQPSESKPKSNKETRPEKPKTEKPVEKPVEVSKEKPAAPDKEKPKVDSWTVDPFHQPGTK